MGERVCSGLQFQWDTVCHDREDTAASRKLAGHIAACTQEVESQQEVGLGYESSSPVLVLYLTSYSKAPPPKHPITFPKS